MNKAVFSDLDGTLIHTKSGKKFPKDINDWVLDYTLLDAIYGYMLKHLTGTLCIVTNQGGVGAGYWKRNEIDTKVKIIADAITSYYLDKYSYNVRVDYGISYTTDKSNFMRKPNPGLGYHLALRNNLSLVNCIMIGDSDGSDGSHSDDDVNFASNCVMNFNDIESFIAFYNPNEIYKNPF